jgi:hypothetical protein
MPFSMEAKVRRRLRRLGATRTVTVDDADAVFLAAGTFIDRVVTNRVLRAEFRPVGFKRTTVSTRHGRPVRSWKLVRPRAR